MLYDILVYFVYMSLNFDHFLVATILFLSHYLRNIKKLPLDNLNYTIATLAAWCYRNAILVLLLM